MKLNRRSFLMLIPVGAIAAWSWWFLRPTAKMPVNLLQVSGTSSMESQAGAVTSIELQTTSTESMTSQTSSTLELEPSQTSSTLESFQFPVTWDGEYPPIIDPNNYRLIIDGDVPNPLELKLADLYAMTSTHKTLPIQCVEGWSADVPWEGIPLLYLLRQAGTSLTNIAHVTVQDAAGYSTTLSSDEVASLDCMIALKTGGVPLSADHGYPARLVAPTRVGEDWVKCVGRITATSH